MDIEHDVLYDFDCRYDADSRHVPVYARVNCYMHDHGVARTDRIQVDIHKFSDDDAVKKYKSIHASMAPPSINMHPEQQFMHALRNQQGAAEMAFPMERKVIKKKPHLASQTFQLVVERKCLRKVKRRIGRVLRMCSAEEAGPLVLARSSLAEPLKKLSYDIRSRSYDDYCSYLDNLAERVSESNFKHQPRIAYDGVKRLLRSNRKSKWRREKYIPLLYNSQGVPAATQVEAANIFMQHFGEPECAVVREPDDYVYQYCRGLNHAVSQGPSDVHVDDVMTYPELVCSFSHSKKGKAPDLHGLRGELLALAPVESARQWHPVIASAQLTQQEPISFKGGLACPMPKGANGGGTHVASGYREILLASIISKHHYSFIRSRLHIVVDQLYVESQNGGMCGRSTDMASLFIRMHSEYLKANKLAGFAFFGDLKSAFYSIVRDFILPIKDSDTLDQLIDSIPIALIPAVEEIIA
eukprot:10753174-Karenia_brevis.AAC.1